MKKRLIKWLCCPECKSRLNLSIFEERNDEIYSGCLACSCGRKYEIIHYVPRFVDTDKYADSFSFEWNKFRTIQLDSYNNSLRSECQFKQNLDMPIEKLNTKLILDVGCGPGRFMEILHKYHGEIIGIDLSFAVDAAFRNMGLKKNIHLVQADIFRLPFRDNTFDFIYSMGVLHHTNNCKKAFKMLPSLLRAGGKITITLYSSYNPIYVASSQLLRTATTKLPKVFMYYLSHSAIFLYWLYRIPLFGDISRCILPISMDSDWRWRVLDTFDHYTPKYESHHTHQEVFQWFDEAGLKNIKPLGPGVSFIGQK